MRGGRPGPEPSTPEPRTKPHHTPAEPDPQTKVKERLGGRVRIIVSGGAPLAPHVEEFLRVAMCAPVAQVRGGVCVGWGELCVVLGVGEGGAVPGGVLPPPPDRPL